MEKVNDNAYKLDLLEGYNVSPTFNMHDLIPYLEDGVGVEDDTNLRANLFQQGGDAMPRHGGIGLSSPREEELEFESPMEQGELYMRLITRSRAKLVNLVT